MIKFYQGLWAQISGKVSDANNIVFVTDRQSLMMGGQEYGKTADTIVTSGVILESGGSAVKKGAVLSASDVKHNYREGTLVYCSDDQTLLRYAGTGTAGTNWQVIQQPRLSAAEFISGNNADGTIAYTPSAASDAYFATANDVKTGIQNLETRLSTAYTAGTAKSHTEVTSGTNTVLVSVPSGVQRTDYVLDNSTTTSVSAQITDTSKSADAKDAVLDNTLVNARTLAIVYEDLKSQAATIATPSLNTSATSAANAGIVSFTKTSGLAGTEWVATTHILTGKTSGSLTVNDGRLENHIALRQVATQEGFLASYALFNENAGSGETERLQIGDTINLVKDQFLKGASYVKAIVDTDSTAGYLDLTEANYTANTTKFLNAVGASTPAPATYAAFVELYGNKINRFLKLEFALTRSGDKADTDDSQVTPDSSSDTDSVIYIDVNELFDSYNGVSGVAIDQATNLISAQIDSAKNETGTHIATTFFNNGADGLYVSGVNAEITGYIQDLSGVSVNGVTNTITAIDQVSALASNGKFLTMVGVDANGHLTGQMASGFASTINFTPITAVDDKSTSDTIGITATNVQGAIATIATHIGKLDYTYDGTSDTYKNNAGEPTNFIYAITQADGKVAVTGKVVEAGDLNAMSETSPALTASLWNSATSAYVDTLKAVPVYAIASAGTTSGSIQQALADIVDSTATTFADLDMAVVGTIPGNTQLRTNNNSVVPSAVQQANQYEAYKIVNTIKQQDGYVSATDLLLVAQTVGFEPLVTNAADPATLNNGSGTRVASTTAGAYIPVSGYTVGAALSSISNYIGSLDFTTDTAGEAPASGAATKYSIVTTVKQEQGQVSDTKIDLTAGNTYVDAINAVKTGSRDAVRVAVIPDASITDRDTRIQSSDGKSGTIQMALDRISNIIADYGSFHDANDQVI